MQCFSTAYQNKVLTVPLDWLAKIMIYNSWQQLSTDLKYYGLVPDIQAQSIRFQRDSFLSSKPIVSIIPFTVLKKYKVNEIKLIRAVYFLWISRRSPGRSILSIVNWMSPLKIYCCSIFLIRKKPLAKLLEKERNCVI